MLLEVGSTVRCNIVCFDLLCGCGLLIYALGKARGVATLHSAASCTVMCIVIKYCATHLDFMVTC